jgi:hypothetical protein
MMTIERKRTTQNFFIFTRTTALTIAWACVASSCMKPPDYENQDGPKVSVEALRNALAEGWGEFNPHEMLKGEANSQERTVQISTLKPRLTLLKTASVYEIKTPQEEPNILLYSIVLESKEDPENELPVPTTRERPISAPKDNSQAAKSFANLSLQGIPLAAKLHQGALRTIQKYSDTETPIAALNDDETDSQMISADMLFSLWHMCTPPSPRLVQLGLINIECFNLKVTKVKEAPPKNPKNGNNCGNLPQCQLLATTIQFDIVYSTKDNKTETTTRTKISYTIKMSHDVPFLSKILDLCYLGMASAQNQKFPVTICYKTTHIQAGVPETSTTGATDSGSLE